MTSVKRGLDLVLNYVPSGSGCRSIDSENPSRKTLAVEPFHCRLQVPRILEFNKAEPSRMTSHPIAYYLCERYGMALIFKPLP